jgi:DNA-binding SARP family transcriptional activator/alpha-beta hydrolase superfamily lysophospholipase
MPGMIEIRLIGDLAVIREGEPVKLPNSRKTRALLAYLILNPGAHRRERLCEIFWQLPDNPRGALRWSLSKLRPLVDDEEARRIVADRQTAAFDTDGVAIDLFELRDTLSDGPQALSTEELKQVTATASMNLLEGLELGGQPDFDHFLSSEREAYRVLQRDALLELIKRLDRSPGEAVSWLQCLVEIEPYSLQAHRALIDALVKSGRKRDAERQLKSSLAVLKDIEDIDVSALKHAAAGRPSQSDGVQFASAAAGPRDLDQQIRFCKATDGTQIAYATVGEGPPLVKTANWLNHLDFDWESPVWKHVFRGLSDGRKLIRYDARGNGLSDWDIEDFSFERQVEDLEAVIEATGLDRFPLLGISQGCAISAAYATRHPEKVTKLILIGGYARGWKQVGNPDTIRETEAMITLIRIGWGRDNSTFRQMFTSMFMPDAPPENQSWFNELQRISTKPKNAANLLRALGDVDVRDELDKVRAPTLVMHAKGDLRVPFQSGRELAGGIPGARFVTLDTRNHIMPESDPAWSVALMEINEFLAED